MVSVMSWNSATGTRSSPRRLRFAALRLRIEGADRLQRVAEEIEPHRHVHAGRKQIEDAAAHRVFARLAHGRGAGEAVELQPFDHAVHAEHIAGRHRQRMGGDEFARRHALQRGVDRGQQHRRLVAALHARQPRQRGHALRHHAGIRRHAVVGQAIPGREFHHHDIGTEERQRARQRRHALAVAADHGKRNRRRVGARRNARARSASTSPSAPSATCASVSALPGRNNSAGDFAIALTSIVGPS